MPTIATGHSRTAAPACAGQPQPVSALFHSPGPAGLRRVALVAGVAAAAALTAFAGPLPALAQTKAAAKAESKPAAPQSVADRARALLRAGRPVQALAVLRPAVEARPNDLSLLFLVG